MNLAKKVALNTIIQFASKIISIILGLFAIAIMTRYLGQTGFGQYTTIITFLSFFAVVADLGLTLVTVQMITQPGVDQNKVLSNLFSLRLFSAVIFLLLAPLTVIFLPYDNAIKIGVIIAAFSFLFTAMNQVLVGLFQKNLRMDKVSIAEVLSRLILVAGIYLSVKIDSGLNGILIATVVSNLASFAIHYFYASKMATIKMNFDFRVWLDIIRKSWPIGLTIVFNLIYLRADTLILSFFKTQADVGIYGATYKVIDVLITLPFIFAGIVLPIITASWLNDKARFEKILQRSFDLMTIIALPLFFGAQFVSTRIMTLVAGKEFEASGPILEILIAACSIIYLGTMFSHAVIAIDKQKKIILAYIFTAVTSLAAYLIFIPMYSYFGAAWVTIYSELTIALASAFLVWKYSRFIPNFKIFGKALIASLAMSLVLYFSQGLNLILIIALAVASYTAFLFLVKGISKQDILELITKS